MSDGGERPASRSAFLSSGKFQVSFQQKAVSAQIKNGKNSEGKRRLKVDIPQNLTPCSSIDICRCFGAKRSLYLQSCSLNMGRGRFFEMSVNLSWTTRRHIPADVLFTVTAMKSSNLVEKCTTLPEISNPRFSSYPPRCLFAKMDDTLFGASLKFLVGI